MGRRTALIYLGAVAGTALASGLLLDWILPNGIVTRLGEAHTMLPGWLASGSAVVLFFVLGVAMLKVGHRSGQHPVEDGGGPLTKFRVDGMTCEHCAERVSAALLAEPGVLSARVSLADRTVEVGGSSFNVEHMKSAVQKLGYSMSEREGPTGKQGS